MHDPIGAVRYCLGNLTKFGGRDSRTVFWPYAGFVTLLYGVMFVIGMTLFVSSIPVQESASVATSSLNADQLGTRLKNLGYGHTVLVGVIVFLMAAAITRRLHDAEKSPYWGLMPLPFLIFASVKIPGAFKQAVSSTDSNASDFLLMFANNVIYIITILIVISLLALPTINTQEYKGNDDGRSA